MGVDRDEYSVVIEDADLGLLWHCARILGRPVGEVLAAVMHRGCDALRADLEGERAGHVVVN